MSASLAVSAVGRQFVTFWVEGEVFGVPLAEVQEIIRMPGVVRVPLASPNLEGIANLRGAVLPITNLRRVFGMREVPHDDATRVVVTNRGCLSGFVVDRMASVISTEPQEIEPIELIAGTIRTDLLLGMVKREQGTIMLLDPPTPAGRSVPPPSRAGGADVGFTPSQARGTQAATGQSEVLQLVSFEVASQEYAFVIEDVQEIVQVPARLSAVPRSEAHVVGVMTLRQRLLPLVSLRRMFDLPAAPLAEHNRIVVVSLGDEDGQPVSVGIIMDSVNEVLRVSRALVEPVPGLLVPASGGSALESICRLEGDRLVTILSASRMFPAIARAQLQEGLAAMSSTEETVAEQPGDAPAADDEQFVVFRLGTEEYGVPIGAVQEIVRIPEHLTHVPKTPAFIEGVINLRGVVLPVIDQRRRFGLPELARNDRQRIMVLMVGALRTGFIVDSVVEVLKVARDSIGAAPHLSEDQKKLIDRVANLNDQRRMLLLIRPAQLLSIAEQGSLGDL